MPSATSGSEPSPGPDKRFLIFAAILPLLSVLDLLTLSRISIGALGVRVVWALELVACAFLFERASEPWRRVINLGNSALGALLYLAIVHFTGDVESPYVHLVPTLPLMVACIYPEEAGAAVASGIICMLGVWGLVWMADGAHTLGISWASVVAMATFFGMYGSSRFRKVTEARNEARVERARREAMEKLTLTVRQQAQSERLATVGRMAASVMHEINNPLAFVRSNLNFIQTEVLAQPLESGVRGELAEVLSETCSGLDRIQQIVTDLKGFSRMDVEEASECALAGVVADAVRLGAVRLKHVAEVKVEVPENLPVVFATPRRLVQVLLNLLVNAGDSLEDARVARGEILVRSEVRNQRVALLVEDNGPGFPPEVLSRLFESFFTTKGPEKGTGLGLVISRQLLEHFGGTLIAENRAEGGARLCIELPVYRG
ncbi:sensor histidine kinase [Vitiosangium sp. GDMCC 1.1324]|uniref:sensor histidine kinase n=1 Tax=Vitiosangium sp. (strain GDMCC 1.1324) TaxID=2138576 RepID=UPI000D3C2246|nr:ATP-binding protein [Vitiosangium sp. GDMCC 1.1324]PTL80830.1 two-component sensor histidine kinase [Vitiosangium sp. GDMCC 1.1324]